MLNPSTNGSIQRLSLQIFQHLLHKHPLAFLGGTWASLMLVAYLAACGLLSPGSMEREKPPETTPSAMVEDSRTDLPSSTAVQGSQTPQPASTAVQDLPTSQRGFTKVRVSSPEEGMPMWLFGALALSCATGTLLIYGSLRHSQPRRTPVKRKETSQKASPTTAIRKKRQLPSRRHRLKKPISMPQPPRSVADQPVVTVLPPDESHPLDWGEDSLADMMDLRKRQSLSSLLRNRP